MALNAEQEDANGNWIPPNHFKPNPQIDEFGYLLEVRRASEIQKVQKTEVSQDASMNQILTEDIQ